MKTYIILLFSLMAFGVTNCSDDQQAEEVDEVSGEPGKKDGQKAGDAKATAGGAAKLPNDAVAETPKTPDVSTKPSGNMGAGEGEGAAMGGAVSNKMGGHAYVAVEALNVRSGAGVSHSVVGAIPFGKKVQVLKPGSWVKIGEGRYVYGKYLTNHKQSTPIANPKVVNSAQ